MVMSSSEHVVHRTHWLHSTSGDGILHFVPTRPDSPSNEELWDNGQAIAVTACERTLVVEWTAAALQDRDPRCNDCCRALEETRA